MNRTTIEGISLTETELKSLTTLRPLKQVIVIRRDLNMRQGKAVAQGAHASMMWLVNSVLGGKSWSKQRLLEWVIGSAMMKVCVRVESEQELHDIYEAAASAGLIVEMIVDAGHTEFHGVPTRTCVAIGPDDVDKVDAITRHLKLL